MLVVVKIPEKVKAGGAKGHYYKRSFKEYKPNRIDSKKSKESWSRGTRRTVQKTAGRNTGCRKGINITGETISKSQTRAQTSARVNGNAGFTDIMPLRSWHPNVDL
jgi:hypothetical protein